MIPKGPAQHAKGELNSGQQLVGQPNLGVLLSNNLTPAKQGPTIYNNARVFSSQSNSRVTRRPLYVGWMDVYQPLE